MRIFGLLLALSLVAALGGCDPHAGTATPSAGGAPTGSAAAPGGGGASGGMAY
jgi:hypothetical protein